MLETLTSSFITPLDQANSLVLLAAIFSFTAFTFYSYKAADAEYPGFPFVGRDEQTKGTWQLKMRWIKEAKNLVYGTLSRVRNRRITHTAYEAHSQ